MCICCFSRGQVLPSRDLFHSVHLCFLVRSKNICQIGISPHIKSELTWAGSALDRVHSKRREMTWRPTFLFWDKLLFTFGSECFQNTSLRVKTSRDHMTNDTIFHQRIFFAAHHHSILYLVLLYVSDILKCSDPQTCSSFRIKSFDRSITTTTLVIWSKPTRWSSKRQTCQDQTPPRDRVMLLMKTTQPHLHRHQLFDTTELHKMLIWRISGKLTTH